MLLTPGAKGTFENLSSCLLATVENFFLSVGLVTNLQVFKRALQARRSWDSKTGMSQHLTLSLLVWLSGFCACLMSF